MKYSLIIFLLAALLSCKKSTEQTEQNVQVAACMQTQIDSALAKPKGSLIIKIEAYQYQSKIVYLYYSGCCDRYNDLKDGNCNYLFSPSGGIAGGGDRSHPAFFSEAIFIKTVWTDPRL